MAETIQSLKNTIDAMASRFMEVETMLMQVQEIVKVNQEIIKGLQENVPLPSGFIPGFSNPNPEVPEPTDPVKNDLPAKPELYFKGLFSKGVGEVTYNLGEDGLWIIEKPFGFTVIRWESERLNGYPNDPELLGPNADLRVLRSQYGRVLDSIFVPLYGKNWHKDYDPGPQYGLTSNFTGLPVDLFSCMKTKVNGMKDGFK